MSLLTWPDRILIFFLIIANIALIFWIKNGGSTRKVIIEADQKVVGIYKLNSPPRKITVKGPLGPSAIEIQEGKVRMISSPCPHKNCIRTGWIGGQGQIICCVPNKILVRISGEEGETSLHLDGISR